MNTRKTGAEYERAAAEYLQGCGVQILARNYRSRRGEIDLIGKDGEYTAFIEVKYRRDNKKGAPGEAVNFAKQKTICAVADYYRMTHCIGEFAAIRYDVVAIEGEKITWYKNAFAHIYNERK
ncbi:MAG: YraN family protein [Lachnospiraceae bacterium]|nr:YraN family protein [Lachnospiraceae bacterium]